MIVLQFPFGEMNIYENFVITMMKEGITVIPEHNKELELVAEKYFHGKRFGYISYRKHSYAVNPLVYIQTSKIPNLVAFAIVTTREMQLSNIEIEKIFLKVPFGSFHSLNEAKKWVDSIIENRPGSDK